jgi:alpha-tubulin suppressor-like RCC1 family protein
VKEGATGSILCWGSDAQGQLGDGPLVGTRDTADHTNAVVFPAGVTLATGVKPAPVLAASATTACIVTKVGEVYCWGGGASGQLGNGQKVNSPLPVKVTGVTGAFTVSVGYITSCAGFLAGGNQSAVCWGNNASAQAGVGVPPLNNGDPYGDTKLGLGNVKLSAIVDLTGVTALASGGGDNGVGGPEPFGHTCAISNAGLRCWGSNYTRELGPATPPSSPFYSEFALAVPQSFSAIAVSVGASHSCALASDAVYCFGANWRGELGVAPAAAGYPISKDPIKTPLSATRLASSSHPAQVPDPDDPGSPILVELGSNCALTTDTPPAIKCWGDNTSHQLGNAGPSTHVPTLVEFP